jgi:hypothetical protein
MREFQGGQNDYSKAEIIIVTLTIRRAKKISIEKKGKKCEDMLAKKKIEENKEVVVVVTDKELEIEKPKNAAKYKVERRYLYRGEKIKKYKKMKHKNKKRLGLKSKEKVYSKII